MSASDMGSALRALRSADPQGSYMLRAADFQGALEGAGLSFGTPAVDHILSLCDVDDAGVVDYARFSEEIERSPVNPVRDSQRGLEFENSLGQGATGRGGAPAGRPLEPGFRQTAQVQALNTHLAQLYNDFDHGKVTHDMFRQKLRDMDLHETSDMKRMLRQPHGFSLRQMIQALSAPVGFDVAQNHAAGKARSTGDTQNMFGTTADSLNK